MQRSALRLRLRRFKTLTKTVLKWECMAPFTRLLCLGRISILLFESLGVLWVLSYTASHPNHTSSRKCYFNEFVVNVLRDNMGIIIFDLRGSLGC